MIDLAAYIFKFVGVAFLLIAAVGVLRLPDAFTRMHAATKAGTLGAGLVVFGSALSTPGVEAFAITLLTVFVLVLTVPLASHLLARAAYLSGAPFWQGTTEDRLKDVLPRGGEDLAASSGGEIVPFEIDRIVVAPTHGGDGTSTTQAVTLARSLDKPLVGIGLIDPVFFADATDDLRIARERLGDAIARAETISEGVMGVVEMEEGDPLTVVPRFLHKTDLLVIPGDGWFNHGVGREPDDMSGRGERLLPLARSVSVPVLLAGPDIPVTRVTVLDDGSDRIAQALATVAKDKPFGDASITVVAVGTERATPERRTQISQICSETELKFSTASPNEGMVHDPGQVLVCGSLPAARADRYGMDWRDRISPGWRGQVLLV